MATITIDGPSGSGKTTIAQLLATRLECPFLDVGLVYRAITQRLKSSTDCEVKQALISTEFLNQLAGSATDPTLFSRTIEEQVATIASSKEWRLLVKEVQISWAQQHEICIVVGRVGGTHIFPNAIAKIFVVANSSAIAARRREGAAYTTRDKADRTRTFEPLCRSDDALIIDNSDISPECAVKLIIDQLGTHASFH